jgi:hypothetical protein
MAFFAHIVCINFEPQVAEDSICLFVFNMEAVRRAFTPELKQLDINLDDDLDDATPITYTKMSDLGTDLDD